MAYAFQTDKDAVPIFFINKDTWTDEYKYIINSCLDIGHAYLLVHTKQFGIVEIVCLCRADFNEQIKKIDNLINQ